jgi:pimeloyl-ACP methyl ester carboxylesterase
MAFYRDYHSTVESGLRLFASFTPAEHPAALMIWMHGWHGNIKSGHRDNVAPLANAAFFKVAPEMRGRGDSGGRPDANGWELQDAVDALDAAREYYPELVSDRAPHLHGGSGGGGNVLGLLGKFPDLFASAVCECGISDYALWFAQDAVGEFRDDMRDAGWIGGDPHTNPEAYLSRGGRTTAGNLLTPLLMIHGEDDIRVPVEQARVYRQALQRFGNDSLAVLQVFEGVGVPGHFSGLNEEGALLREQLTAQHRDSHTLAPILPQSGELVVAGYLKTRHFELHLETKDQVALLRYHVAENKFTLRAPSCALAKVRCTNDSRWLSISCEKISLGGFCDALGLPDPRDLPLLPEV